jgi:hypothetical protein
MVKSRTSISGKELQDLVLGMGTQLVRKVGSGRTKLSVIRVKSLTSSCWVHNFADLTPNLVLG